MTTLQTALYATLWTALAIPVAMGLADTGHYRARLQVDGLAFAIVFAWLEDAGLLVWTWIA